MPGETSKRSGEFGEEVVKKLLHLIGWSNPPSNYDIPCQDGLYHRDGDSDRKTHGIDFSYNYESNLISNRQESTVISAKYRAAYPPSPTTQFKTFLKELAFTIRCFRYLDQFLQSVAGNINSKNVNGVLFWLSRNDNHKKSILDEIVDFRLSDGFEYGPIYLVDNLRASFLYTVVEKCETQFKKGFDFVYQTTGSNFSSLNRRSFGRLLPVEQINSPVHLVRGTSRSEDVLAVFCIEKFSEDGLKRLIGLARDITEQWASQIFIYFTGFKKYEHELSVNTVKALFADKSLTEKISVRNLAIQSFRDLEEEDD